jgi:hypothetical protein
LKKVMTPRPSDGTYALITKGLRLNGLIHFQPKDDGTYALITKGLRPDGGYLLLGCLLMEPMP